MHNLPEMHYGTGYKPAPSILRPKKHFLRCNNSMPACFILACLAKNHIPAKKCVTYMKEGRRKTA